MAMTMNLPAAALLVLGLLPYTSELLIRSGATGVGGAVSQFAAATGAAPALDMLPARRGFDPFTNQVQIDCLLADGQSQMLELTPERTQLLLGPSARRNVILNILASGPIFATENATQPMFNAVFNSALSSTAPIMSELRAGATAKRIRHEPRWIDTMAAGWPRVIEVNRE